jgi:3'-5' exonuclease
MAPLPNLPKGSSLLEQRLLVLIDKQQDGRIAMDKVGLMYLPSSKALHADLQSVKAKSVKQAVESNMLPCIARVKGKKKKNTWCLTRSVLGSNKLRQGEGAVSAAVETSVRSAAPALQEPDALPHVQLVDELARLESLRLLPIFEAQRIESAALFAPFHLLFPIPTAKTAPDVGYEVVAVGCHGGSDGLYLIEIATKDVIYVFDCVKLEGSQVLSFLAPMFTNGNVLKLFHDLHKCITVFSSLDGFESSFRGTFDTQLAVEALEPGNYNAGLNAMLSHFHIQPKAKNILWKEPIEGSPVFLKRPMSQEVLRSAVSTVDTLVTAYAKIKVNIGSSWHAVQRASDTRMMKACETGGKRQICFDVANFYSIGSLELIQELRPQDVFVQTQLKVSNEAATLISMLPNDLAVAIRDRTAKMSDIVLDNGRCPHAWIDGERIFIGGDDRLVGMDEVSMIVEQLGGFGTDNRSGLEKQLHRISAIRNRDEKIIGLTMRVGRHVDGNANIIQDLLFANEEASILFLGEPGSGEWLSFPITELM